MREKQANRRIRLLLVIFAIVFAACLARAVWLQGVRAASLGRQASLQHHESITIPAGRGTIFDTNGVQLAIGEQTTTVYADPRQVTNARAVAVAAHDILGVDGNELYAALLNKKAGFIYVQRFADPKLAARFLSKKFNGVNGYSEEKRAYPQGNVASQVIGFAGTDDKGLGGLEIKYDHDLTGKAGKQVIVRDPFGRAIDVVSSTSERQGRDLFTTIDNKIQANAQQVLRDTVAKYHARSATAIVLDPHTGAVLAMAQAPGYNANNASHTPQALQTNHAVTDVFEPGSVFKLVTVSGALSEGLVTPETKFGLPSCIQIADKCIHDAEPRGYETMSVAQILSRSSNVGAVTIAK
jgi:cell division protein FtsI/penicillin-binding protein 2